MHVADDIGDTISIDTAGDADDDNVCNPEVNDPVYAPIPFIVSFGSTIIVRNISPVHGCLT